MALSRIWVFACLPVLERFLGGRRGDVGVRHWRHALDRVQIPEPCRCVPVWPREGLGRGSSLGQVWFMLANQGTCGLCSPMAKKNGRSPLATSLPNVPLAILAIVSIACAVILLSWIAGSSASSYLYARRPFVFFVSRAASLGSNRPPLLRSPPVGYTASLLHEIFASYVAIRIVFDNLYASK